jgi:hypothetical protein
MLRVWYYIFATAFLSSQLVQPFMNPAPFSLRQCLRVTHTSDHCSSNEFNGLKTYSSRTATLLSTKGGGHRLLLCKSTPRPFGGGQRKAATASPPQRKRAPPPSLSPPSPSSKSMARGAASPAPARATAAERLQWAATPAAILDAFERSPPPRLLPVA